MKVLLSKCGICNHWYMPSAHVYHCPNCNAGKLMVQGKPYYINVMNGKLMGSALRIMPRARENMLAIAREISD